MVLKKYIIVVRIEKSYILYFMRSHTGGVHRGVLISFFFLKKEFVT